MEKFLNAVTLLIAGAVVLGVFVEVLLEMKESYEERKGKK